LRKIAHLVILKQASFVGNPIIQPTVLGAASIDVAFEE
jgi:hypothetical protein